MKKYKNLLSIFLCIILVFSMTACVRKESSPSIENTTEATLPTEETKIDNTETTAPTVENNDETAPTTLEPPKMEYKMVGLHKSEVDKYGGYMWVVIEMKTLGWLLDMNSVVVTDIRNNEELHIDAIYPGMVCANNHRADYYGATNGQVNDYKQYTLQIYIEDASINFEDLQIVGEVSWMNPEYQSTDDVSHQFLFDGTVDDITTQQPYIHGYTLFKVGEAYYIFEPQSGGFQDDEIGTYREFEVFHINGTIESLVDTFSKNYEFVYSTYDYKDKYLQNVENSNNWETILKKDDIFEDECELYFGYRYKTDEENESMDTLIENLALKTQLSEGIWTCFVFAFD